VLKFQNNARPAPGGACPPLSISMTIHRERACGWKPRCQRQPFGPLCSASLYVVASPCARGHTVAGRWQNILNLDIEHTTLGNCLSTRYSPAGAMETYLCGL